LLSLGIVGSLLGMVFDMEIIRSVFPDLQIHLMDGISTRILYGILYPDGSIVQPCIEYLVYLAIAIVLSVIAFNRKEMEF
jgi:hypothetical protein